MLSRPTSITAKAPRHQDAKPIKTSKAVTSSRDTVTIETGDGNNWSNRQNVLEGSSQFAKSGGKLIKLEFPKTEIQVYGNTAVVYSNYAYELEADGRRINQSSRVTEVFVMRRGQWVNPGWHMDSGK